MPAVPVPMTLTQQVADIYAQLKRLRTATSAGAGFDPNADPVVIGNAATANTTTQSVAIGLSADVAGNGSVAVGPYTFALSTYATAIGGANSYTANDVAIGSGATTGSGATGSGGAIAIGVSSAGDAPGTVAVGASSYASGTHAAAFGAGATAGPGYSTAVGAGASTTHIYQVMLGTAQGFVEIPGDSSTAPNGLVLTDTADGTRYLVQITSGALVLSAAP